jgi:hypothetical protein
MNEETLITRTVNLKSVFLSKRFEGIGISGLLTKELQDEKTVRLRVMLLM